MDFFRKHRLVAISTPFILIAIALSAYYALKFFDLPSEDELLTRFRGWFEAYGYPMLLISATIEAMLLVGLYYPGSVVIFLGVILARNAEEVVYVVLTVSLGFFIASVINYGLGKYGWYKLLVRFGLSDSIERMRGKLSGAGVKTLLVSASIPNALSLAATAAGIISFPFVTFLLSTAIAVLLWNTMWGTLVGILGERALTLLGVKAVAAFIIIWILVSMVRTVKEKTHENEDEKKDESVS